MAHDPTDEIFAELERKYRRDETPEYREPDPGLGAAAPEAVAETVRHAEDRAARSQRFRADAAHFGAGAAIARRLWQHWKSR